MAEYKVAMTLSVTADSEAEALDLANLFARRTDDLFRKPFDWLEVGLEYGLSRKTPILKTLRVQPV